MKYIDADKLIERLEEMKQAEYENCGGVNSKTGALYEVQELITSLQQEQPEVDLEKETKRWWKEHLHLNPENQLWMDAHQSVVFARHFYELGRNARKEE